MEKLPIYRLLEAECIDQLIDHGFSTHEARQFDIAHKAINMDELAYVIENTDSMLIQDYAMTKKIFFQMKESNKGKLK